MEKECTNIDRIYVYARQIVGNFGPHICSIIVYKMKILEPLNTSIVCFLGFFIGITINIMTIYRIKKRKLDRLQ